MRRRPTLLGTLRWALCKLQGHPLTELDAEYDIHRCPCGASEKTGEELANGSGYDPFDRYFRSCSYTGDPAMLPRMSD